MSDQNLSPSLSVDTSQQDLVAAFRLHHNRFVEAIQQAIATSADSTVLERLGDDLDQYLALINDHTDIFGPAELDMLRFNVMSMQNDVRLQFQEMLDQSHHGRPTVIEVVHSDGPGRPRYRIDPDFLRWAYTLRSTASIAHFLNVGRSVVRNALLEYGIAQPQVNPFPAPDSTGNILHHFSRAGITMLDGMLRLIRWGIVIHGFIDGYSRLITGLRASDNNRAQTVLDLFLDAAQKYGTMAPKIFLLLHGWRQCVGSGLDHIYGEG
ncbi:hypothetical protein B0H21DRAFT_704192 [Amylocystis lapponica]|nr:hypothetical protein B0H21DRAFT_704192 [Amylocystis lapponica]